MEIIMTNIHHERMRLHDLMIMELNKSQPTQAVCEFLREALSNLEANVKNLIIMENQSTQPRDQDQSSNLTKKGLIFH